jgi:3-methyladenine DNA glycosylase AlkD
MHSEDLIAELRMHANPANVEGMARYGISPVGTLGVSMPVVRSLARDAKRATARDWGARHELAEELWSSGVHEARILAALVDVPSLVCDSQMDRWVADVDSWDVCDQLCGNLFDKTPIAWDKAVEWAGSESEFTKRAGFVLMTQLAVHDKSAADELFTPFLPLIEREADDGRPYVKKAVNWALRQIGKRDAALHMLAVDTAERILAEQSASPSARWIARDALRELRSDAVLARLEARRPA